MILIPILRRSQEYFTYYIVGETVQSVGCRIKCIYMTYYIPVIIRINQPVQF